MLITFLVFLMISLALRGASADALSVPFDHSSAHPNMTHPSPLSPRELHVSGSCNDLQNRLNVKFAKGAIGIDYFDVARASKRCAKLCTNKYWPNSNTKDYTFNYRNEPKIKIRIQCMITYHGNFVHGKIDKDVCNNMFYTITQECTKFGGELEDLDTKAVYQISGFRMKK
ncbi:MAG: hypothetical protein L6R35_007393 [Caloplaca aegaea]|nr:MAG: hypothetical protein L6R35_007393 [Caloplaca aegaea]